ncbi:MAG: hypothetical protein ACOCYV_03295 [Planctomycetota bacterium]
MRKSTLLLVAVFLLAGCGDAVYQTRYIPHHHDLSWDDSWEQLPWREPALPGNPHYAHHENPQRPGAREQTAYSLGRSPLDFHYTGDHCSAVLEDSTRDE